MNADDVMGWRNLIVLVKWVDQHGQRVDHEFGSKLEALEFMVAIARNGALCVDWEVL